MTVIEPGGPSKLMYFVIFSQRTAFLKLEDVLPECFYLRRESPQLEPLLCLLEDNACHVNQNCMEKLVKRLHVLFEEVMHGIDLILLYYRQRAVVDSIGCGIFWRNLRDFKIATINRSAWAMIKNRGNVFQFQPATEFYLSGAASAPPEEPESPEEIILD